MQIFLHFIWYIFKNELTSLKCGVILALSFKETWLCSFARKSVSQAGIILQTLMDTPNQQIETHMKKEAGSQSDVVFEAHTHLF